MSEIPSKSSDREPQSLAELKARVNALHDKLTSAFGRLGIDDWFDGSFSIARHNPAYTLLTTYELSKAHEVGGFYVETAPTVIGQPPIGAGEYLFYQTYGMSRHEDDSIFVSEYVKSSVRGEVTIDIVGIPYGRVAESRLDFDKIITNIEEIVDLLTPEDIIEG